MPEALRLQVTEYTDLTRWGWTLTDADGVFLADHGVHLDPGDWRFEAFGDLRGYISWHADPGERYAEDEARIVADVRAWAAGHVLGGAIANVLARREHRNATVRVLLPPDAEALAFLPLELAAPPGVTLVIETGSADDTAEPAPVSGTLRVLGLFSLPEGGSPLNLRRERHELVTLIRGIAANGHAAEVTVLQYGVTRDRLRDVLEDAGGWDIIHLSGHGAPGELLLETGSGGPDLITAADLASLLELAAGRVRLVTVAACWSAARSAAEQRRLLRLPVLEDQRHISTERPEPSPSVKAPTAPATELADRLGCAVLAMRYPVADDFAIGLSGKLYDLLIRQGQSLPRAVALTLKHLAAGTGGREYPVLSLAAPAMFGATATGLTAKAPERDGPLRVAHSALKLAGFPDQPDRFVGRTGVMARASAALAARSGIPGVVLFGMPGGGKTACALELAYGHEDSFAGLIWFKAPDEAADISGSLMDLALTMERHIGGLEMVDKVASDDALDAFLPVLTELMERTRLLLVIDNAESLLTDAGQWRDGQWGRVADALTGHAGLGRVILTSRRVLTDARGLRVESVDALTADEALLLARELPHLNALIHDEIPGLDRDTSRTLALGVLNVAQGHPKLLELADGQAADPGQLATLIDASNDTWRKQGGLPHGFFADGETAADPGDYLQVLAAWTRTATNLLLPDERDLFWFLCCLEESDREHPVLGGNWDDLWESLGRPGPAPGLDQELAALASRGLAAVRTEADDGNQSYALHPGVAAAGRDHAGPGFQDAVDTEAAAYWRAVFDRTSGENDDGTVDTLLLVRAGLAAVPYLLRQQDWNEAAVLLENAFLQDPSRASAAALLPAVTRIAEHNPRHEDTLALVLRSLDPAAAETRLRAFLGAAAARGDYRAASVAAGRLADLCRDSGRLAEALSLTDRMVGYTGQAGLGPWTQLADQGHRLQALAAMGHADQVLDEVQRLRRHLDTLPDRSGPDEAVSPWDVREVLLDTGRNAALDLGRWQDALDLGTEIIASQHARHAPAAEMARTRFGDHGPLFKLGRIDEALDLLRDCRQVFSDAGDIQGLGKTLSALASTEHERGRGDVALQLERNALRYSYLAADVDGLAASYHNLGLHLRRHARQPAAAATAHLTAALIRALTGIGGTANSGSVASSVREAATDLRELGPGPAADLPADVADLCRRLEALNIPGTDPAALIARLSPDPQTAEHALQDLIAQVREQAETPLGVRDED
jgi:tetratricopeptide (TPR) repeat protein